MKSPCDTNSLYLRLVQHDPADFSKIVPGVAQSWQAAPDGKQIVFQIRKDLVPVGQPGDGRRRRVRCSAASCWTSNPPSSCASRLTKDNVKQRVRADGDKLVLSLTSPTRPS